MAGAGSQLSPELQKRIEEAVEAKVAAAMKNVEQRFTDMLSSLDAKQKELNAAREAAEVAPRVLRPVSDPPRRRSARSWSASAHRPRRARPLRRRSPTRSAGTRTAPSRSATAPARAGYVFDRAGAFLNID